MSELCALARIRAEVARRGPELLVPSVTGDDNIANEYHRIRGLPRVMSALEICVYLDSERDVLWVDNFECGVSWIVGVPLEGRRLWLMPRDCDLESGYHATPHRGCIVR